MNYISFSSVTDSMCNGCKYDWIRTTCICTRICSILCLGNKKQKNFHRELCQLKSERTKVNHNGG